MKVYDFVMWSKPMNSAEENDKMKILTIFHPYALVLHLNDNTTSVEKIVDLINV